MKFEVIAAKEIENLRTQYPEEKSLMFYQTIFSIYTGVVDRHIREKCCFDVKLLDGADEQEPRFRMTLQTAFSRNDKVYDESMPTRTFIKWTARVPDPRMATDDFIVDPEKHISMTHLAIGTQYKDCPYPLSLIFFDATQALMAAEFFPTEYVFHADDHLLQATFFNQDRTRVIHMEVRFKTLMNDFSVIEALDDELRLKARRLTHDLKNVGKRPTNLRGSYRITPRSVDVDGDKFHEFHAYFPNGPQISDWKRDEDWVLPEGRGKEGQYIVMGDFLFRMDDIKGLMVFLNMTTKAGIDGAAFAGGILGQANLFNVLKGKFNLE